jgi:hypothetical protein
MSASLDQRAAVVRILADLGPSFRVTRDALNELGGSSAGEVGRSIRLTAGAQLVTVATDGSSDVWTLRH